jgi:hypothetical protein
MSPAITIAEILAGGVHITPSEAVAVVQKLIEDETSAFDPCPPFGPPALTTVTIHEDGTVRCRGCAITPSVAEVAILLQALLPAGALRVPGGLRYAVARALHEVSASPFDSIDEFSLTLRRFERGNRNDVVRELFSRARSALAMAGADRDPAEPDVERRRTMPPASELRRQLREADQHVYELQTAVAGDRRHMRWSVPISLCLAAGFALVAAGKFMHLERSPRTPVAPLLAASSQDHPPLTTNLRSLPSQSADIRTEDRMLRLDPRAEPDRVGPRPNRAQADARAKSRVRSPAERKSREPAAIERDDRAKASARRPPSAGVIARIRFEWGEL